MIRYNNLTVVILEIRDTTRKTSEVIKFTNPSVEILTNQPLT